MTASLDFAEISSRFSLVRERFDMNDERFPVPEYVFRFHLQSTSSPFKMINGSVV